jgi:hypothetical protein
MGLAGTRPRTKVEAEQLPAAKRSVFLRSRCGFLQPACSAPSDDDGDLAGFETADTGWREAITGVAGYARFVLRSCVFGSSMRGEKAE